MPSLAAPSQSKPSKAQSLLMSQSLKQLCDMWDVTTANIGNPDMPTLRGWLQDEFERRDVAAFNAWIDSVEASPRPFFLPRK